MVLYLYSYLNLFEYIGRGIPEDPGTDFGMSVWIEAPDEQAPLDWGRLVLADYVRARHQHDGSGLGIEGWIEKDEAELERAVGRFPRCRIGEIPAWEGPWRHHNAM